MNEKLKRVIAIIALVFIGIFSVAFVAYLLNATLFNGAIGYCALFFGGVGIALYFVLWISTRGERGQAQNPSEDSEEEEKEADEQKKD